MLKTTGKAGLNLLLLSWASLSTAWAACPADINNLAPGTWCEVANSNLKSVAYQWPSGVTYTQNGVGVDGVMDVWSGGAFDTKRGRLIVWGGGHFAYGGNEIYAFDINTLKWLRVMDPSVPPAENTTYASDGGPVSRHTYDVIEYVPGLDSLCSFGVPSLYSQSGIQNNTDCFNFGTMRWERKADVPTMGYGSYSAVDPVTGNAWMFGSETGCYLSEWNPATNVWTQRSNKVSCYDNTKTATIDAKRRKFVAIGGGEVYSWDISSSGMIPWQSLSTSGANGIVSARNPGFDYDSVSDRLVAWDGGANVYSLNLDTLSWSLITPAAANTVVPTAPNETGTYGRFRYIPSKNAFVVVNSVNQNVFIYKLSSSPGQLPPQTPAKPSVVIK